MTILNVFTGDSRDVVMELGGFKVLTGGTTYFDALFSRSAYYVAASNVEMSFLTDATVSDAWMHLSYYADQVISSATVYPLCTWKMGSIPQFRVVESSPIGTGIQVLKAQTSSNGGTTWVDLATTPATYNLAVGTRVRVDMRLKLGTGGAFTLYINETAALTFSGTITSQTGTFDRVHWARGGSSFAYDCGISELLFADSSTLGMRVCCIYPTAAGAQSDFTGTYAEIDDITPDNSDVIVSNTVGAYSLFTMSDLPAAFNLYSIVGVLTSIVAGNSPDGVPADLQLAYRSGASNFFGSSLSIPKTSAMAYYTELRPLNPLTGAEWSFSEINALQLGVKAV